MTPLNALRIGLLVTWATAAAAMPPVPDIRGDIVGRLQRAQPGLLPGPPTVTSSGEVSTYRFANGQVLHFSHLVLFIGGPLSGNRLTRLGPEMQFRCASGFFVDPGWCMVEEPVLPTTPLVPGLQDDVFLFRSPADVDRQAARVGHVLPRLKSLDWSRHMAVGAVMGRDEPPCSLLTLLDVSDLPDEVRVRYAVQPSPQVMGMAGACESPWGHASDFAIVRRSAKPVRFVRLVFDPLDDKTIAVFQ